MPCMALYKKLAWKQGYCIAIDTACWGCIQLAVTLLSPISLWERCLRLCSPSRKRPKLRPLRHHIYAAAARTLLSLLRSTLLSFLKLCFAWTPAAACDAEARLHQTKDELVVESRDKSLPGNAKSVLPIRSCRDNTRIDASAQQTPAP